MSSNEATNVTVLGTYTRDGSPPTDMADNDRAEQQRRRALVIEQRAALKAGETVETRVKRRAEREKFWAIGSKRVIAISMATWPNSSPRRWANA
jgi:hypothetical protein